MSNFPLFSVVGIEIEYMLVHRDSLDVQAKSDLILQNLAGKQVNEIELGPIAISNELVLHVIELKTNGPKPIHHPIVEDFQQGIQNLQTSLTQYELQLLPTGAHPWMDPLCETQRWPHGNKAIYQQYDKIFNCKGHGWANLQSMHVNLPFSNDHEFCQLHNSIRLLLPLLPALAASTPFLEGHATGFLDARLDFYEKNQRIIPSISGDVIPPFIRSQIQYEQEILTPMYQDIHPMDPEKILQYEWLNSRAAIPKFGYKAIEIRILDTQECVQADIAIAKAIFAILKHWCDSGSNIYLEKIYDTKKLKTLYDQSIKSGFEVPITDDALFEQWQLPRKSGQNMGSIWASLIENVSTQLDSKSQHCLEHILSQGNLSQRLLRACKNNVHKDKLKSLYHQLGDCLVKNQLYTPS